MGELELIKYLRRKYPRKNKDVLLGIGDDAMVMKNGTVISTDSFVEGIHFDYRYFTKFDLGIHCMCATLSDLAAMAAKPICALIGLFVPKGTKFTDLQQLYRGFEYVCKRYRCDISGGDVIESPFWGMTITVIGKAERPLLRNGAKPGDCLYTTGFLGLSEVGRIVLSGGLDRKLFPESIKRHLYPEPRIYEALKLRKFITAGIDTSDGLSTDAYHISEESKVRVIIENIPIHPEVELFCKLKRLSPINFILSSGEDFELLFTAKNVKNFSKIKVYKIGLIAKGKGVYIYSGNKLKRISPTGYEHLR
jgi:thiamine-monophosphate kinase|uniref:Thiamine-monophosphate kinase n=1 Tax=candidate division WOR-3 bacterium TaxID=2052148 RepID=A0A7V3RGJ8_UNCW3